MMHRNRTVSQSLKMCLSLLRIVSTREFDGRLRQNCQDTVAPLEARCGTALLDTHLSASNS